MLIIITAPIKPFKLTYRTDGQETAVTEDLTTNTVRALADVGNTGFCLDYQER
jgi:hypothetical protein